MRYALRGEVDEMLAVAGEPKRVVRFVCVVPLALLRSVCTAVPAAVRVRAQMRSLGVVALGNLLLALRNLRGEGSLRGILGVLRGLLGAANQGRVLRGGQICQLQIRGPNRHDPRVFHPSRHHLPQQGRGAVASGIFA